MILLFILILLSTFIFFSSDFALLHFSALESIVFPLISCRYSSQEDFRGSSKSLAIYPSEYHSSALDMHEQSQSQPPPAHHRFGFRGSRIGGSRESLDVQMQAAQNRESRSLSRSYPTEGSTRHPRASSLPPPEDHLGEDEQVLNFVEPLSSSHVPSLVNTLVRIYWFFFYIHSKNGKYFPPIYSSGNHHN